MSQLFKVSEKTETRSRSYSRGHQDLLGTFKWLISELWHGAHGEGGPIMRGCCNYEGGKKGEKKWGDGCSRNVTLKKEDHLTQNPGPFLHPQTPSHPVHSENV